jgi:hypothetical protein
METIGKLFGFETSNDSDQDFFELCKRTKKLTFDTDYITGSIPRLNTPFKEIKRKDSRYLADTPRFTGTYSQYLNEYLKAFDIVMSRLDPKEKYLFSCSSGSDSRIITGTMMKLQKQGYDFSNVHFLTWVGTEVDSFKEIMKRGGWTNYTIFNDKGDNPYEIGYPDVPTYGWHSYTNQMKWWKGFNPKEYILLSGAMGEVIECEYDNWYYADTWFKTRGEILHKMQKLFKDVYFPMLTEEVLSVSASSPREWKKVLDPRSGRDKTRTDLTELLGLVDIPFADCRYNWNLSESHRTDMLNMYYSGQFYKDYKMKIRPFIKPIHSFKDAKAWGFGVTIYDKL